MSTAASDTQKEYFNEKLEEIADTKLWKSVINKLEEYGWNLEYLKENDPAAYRNFNSIFTILGSSFDLATLGSIGQVAKTWAKETAKWWVKEWIESWIKSWVKESVEEMAEETAKSWLKKELKNDSINNKSWQEQAIKDWLENPQKEREYNLNQKELERSWNKAQFWWEWQLANYKRDWYGKLYKEWKYIEEPNYLVKYDENGVIDMDSVPKSYYHAGWNTHFLPSGPIRNLDDVENNTKSAIEKFASSNTKKEEIWKLPSDLAWWNTDAKINLNREIYKKTTSWVHDKHKNFDPDNLAITLNDFDNSYKSVDELWRETVVVTKTTPHGTEYICAMKKNPDTGDYDVSSFYESFKKEADRKKENRQEFWSKKDINWEWKAKEKLEWQNKEELEWQTNEKLNWQNKEDLEAEAKQETENLNKEDLEWQNKETENSKEKELENEKGKTKEEDLETTETWAEDWDLNPDKDWVSPEEQANKPTNEEFSEQERPLNTKTNDDSPKNFEDLSDAEKILERRKSKADWRKKWKIDEDWNYKPFESKEEFDDYREEFRLDREAKNRWKEQTPFTTFKPKRDLTPIEQAYKAELTSFMEWGRDTAQIWVAPWSLFSDENSTNKKAIKDKKIIMNKRSLKHTNKGYWEIPWENLIIAASDREQAYKFEGKEWRGINLIKRIDKENYISIICREKDADCIVVTSYEIYNDIKLKEVLSDNNNNLKETRKNFLPNKN